MRALVVLALAGLLGGCSLHVARVTWGTNARAPDHTADALVVSAAWGVDFAKAAPSAPAGMNKRMGGDL